MSWAEEQAIDIGPPNWFEEIVPSMGGIIWTTKDGKELKISEMTDDHLYYAYRKFDDKRLAREMLLRLFKKQIV
jgi:hypothetical protein